MWVRQRPAGYKIFCGDLPSDFASAMQVLKDALPDGCGLVPRDCTVRKGRWGYYFAVLVYNDLAKAEAASRKLKAFVLRNGRYLKVQWQQE